MFTVIQNEQQLVVLDVRTQRLRARFAGLLVNTQDLRSDIGNQRRLFDGSEIHEPDAIGIFLQHISADLQRQTRLAEAAHAQQGQQAGTLEQFLDVGKLALAPDEGGDLLRKIIRCRLE